MYYNTTNETNPNLKTYIEKARTQDEIVKGIINQLNKPFSFKDIYKRYPIQNTPITSIRRTLDTLKKQDYIIETGEKVTGLFNRKELQLIKK
jgi:Fe2+ or Zn2+ uptake regulation protein